MKVDPASAGMDEDRLERITEHFSERYVSTGKLPGCQVTVARGQTVGYFRSFGTMDRDATNRSKRTPSGASTR